MDSMRPKSAGLTPLGMLLLIGAAAGAVWVYETSRPAPLELGTVRETDEKAYKPTDPGSFLADLDRLHASMTKSEVEKTIGYLHPSLKSNFEFDSFIDTCGGLWMMKVFFVRDEEDNIGLDRLQIVADAPDAKKCARCMEKQLRMAYGKPEDGRKVLAKFESTFGPSGVRPSALLYFTKGRDRMEFDTTARQSVRLHRQFR